MTRRPTCRMYRIAPKGPKALRARPRVPFCFCAFRSLLVSIITYIINSYIFLFCFSLSVSPPRLSSLRATWSKKRNSTQEGGSARAASSRRAVYEFRSVRTCGPTARPAPRARHTRLCTRWHRPVQRKRRRTPADRRLGCTHRQMPSPTAKAWSETCSSARAGSEGKHAHTPHANRCGAPAPTHTARHASHNPHAVSHTSHAVHTGQDARRRTGFTPNHARSLECTWLASPIWRHGGTRQYLPTAKRRPPRLGPLERAHRTRWCTNANMGMQHAVCDHLERGGNIYTGMRN